MSKTNLSSGREFNDATAVRNTPGMPQPEGKPRFRRIGSPSGEV
jgi:hypothetical protein